MLTVHLSNFIPEQKYIIEILLVEFLGLPVLIADAPGQGDTVVITDGEKTLRLPQVLFRAGRAVLLVEECLPRQPLRQMRVDEEGLDAVLFCQSKLPVIYGEPDESGFWIRRSGTEVVLNVDILGSSFFMLTRMEEVIRQDRDHHSRFPAEAALAFQEGFLDRPIVNEYAEVLWSAITYLWPDLQRRDRNFRMQVTHDVDEAFAYSPLNVANWLKGAAGDLLKRRSPMAALGRLANGSLASLGLPHNDPLDNFDWLMDRSEEMGTQSAFYFMAVSRPPYGGNYRLESRRIRELIRRIASRGHEIGLHPSYETMACGNGLDLELAALRHALADAGLEPGEIGARQHYLRWEAPNTWQAYEDSGLAYDTSVVFAQRVGFRCGTCYDFPVFNLFTRRKLRLIERTLLVMDVTLLHSQYMNLDFDAAGQQMFKLRRAVEKFNGVFRILWHNGWVASPDREKEFYRKAISNRAGSHTVQSKRPERSNGQLKVELTK